MPPEESSPKPPSTFTGASGGVWQPPAPEDVKDYFPQYEIVALLGRGGMGAVYKGWQKSLDRFVAIKILPPDMDDEDANYTQRFKQEAKSMAKLMHLGIVAVFDAGETPTGLLYFVMEFVEGTDVAHMVLSQGKLPPEHALAITAHVCDALQYAHTHGIVHRDIKPANIMVNLEGAVKVADFGLAKHSDPAMGGLTKTNMAMGTPDYVAPEALIAGMNVDGRADIYAVGVMLYQMLTGNIPRGMFTMPSIMVQTDPRFDMIIAKAMQTDREHRYASAAMLRRDLDVILTVPLVKDGDAHSIAAIPKQSLPPKPQAKQPQKPQGQEPAPGGPQNRAPKKDAAPEQKSQISNPKSQIGAAMGIAVAVIVLGALAFLFSGKKPAAEPEATAAAEASAKPSPPIKVAETSKPPVVKTPAPKPTASASTVSASSDQWVDGLAEWWAKSPDVSKGLLAKEAGGSRVADTARGIYLDGGRDITVRATAKGPKGAKSAWMKLALRTKTQGYLVNLNFSGTPGNLTAGPPNGESRKLQILVPSPGFSLTDSHTVEFTAQGDLLTVLLDGRQVAQARDSSIKDSGRILIAGTKGTLIEKLEYRDLTATASATASTVKWHDMLGEWRESKLTVGNPYLKDEGGRVEVLKTLTGATPAPAKAVTPDQALRITCTAPTKYQHKVFLRGGSNSGYEFIIKPSGESMLGSNGAGGGRIGQWPAPDGFDPKVPQTWEFRAVGETLSLLFEGKLIGSATDGLAKEGVPRPFNIDQGTVITAMEYASLGSISATWHDWVADGRRGGGFKAPIFQDDGKELRCTKQMNSEFVRVAQDAAVRVTWTPMLNTSAMSLRALTNFEGVNVSVPSDGTLAIQHWNADGSGRNKHLKKFAFPAGIDPKAEHTLEVRLIGSVLSAWVNGQPVGSVDNVPVWEGTFVIHSHPGQVLKKLEYAVLDGVTEIPAAPSAVTSGPTASAPAASGEQWVGVLPELLSKPLPSGFEKDGSGIRVTNFGVLNFPPKQLSDVAVRVTARGKPPYPRWGIGLRLHSGQGGGNYAANLLGDHGNLLRYKDNNPVELARIGVPAGFSIEDLHTMEFRAQGDKLTVLLDGKEVAAAQDSTHASGTLTVLAEPGAVFTKLEYRELPPSVAESAKDSAMRTASAPAKTTPAAPASVPPVATQATAPAPMPPAADTKAAAPADPVAIRLAEIEKQFLAAYEKQAGAAHKAAVADLNTKFTAALDRSIATVSQAGKLDEALALRNEKTLIQTLGALPEADAEDTTATLKALRKTYRDTMTTLVATRDKNAAPLYTAYDRALANYQDELTKAQKLDEAARVKAVRDHITSQRDQGAGASSPQPGSANPGATAAPPLRQGAPTAMPAAPIAPPLSADKVLSPLPKATPEEIRVVAEWCLGKAGSIVVMDNAVKKRVDKIDRLPKGKLTLVEFKVDEMAMDAEGLKWLAILGRAPDLEVLFFTRNPGTMPVELLRGATKLRILGIKPTAVNDAAFAHLAGLKNLEELHIHSLIEQFTGTGLGYITENLLRLVMDSPTLTQEGMNYLPRFKKLQLLSFNNYSVRGRCLVTDAMLRNVAALPELTELDLAKTRIDGSFLAHLPTSSKLKRLDLGGIMTFKPENFAHIAKLKQLEVLGLPPMTLGNTELAAVASLRMLRDLLVFSNATFTGEGFKGLKGFGSLTLLELSASPVTDAGLAAIAETLPHLKSIRMAHAPEFKSPSTAAGFAVLTSHLKELNDIQIGGSGITDDWMPAIAQAKGVSYMMLTGASVTDQGVAHLMKLPLGYLRLDSTQVTDAVIPILKTCPTLGNVPVSGTKMTDAGKAELQRVLDAHRGK